MKTYRVYLLKDPRTGDPHYVGTTVKELRWRLTCHLTPNGPVYPKDQWIAELKTLGLKPSIELVKEFDDKSGAFTLEDALIECLSKHFMILNIARVGPNGGVSVSGKTLTKEHRSKISKSGKGLKRSEATCNRIKQYALTRPKIHQDRISDGIREAVEKRNK